MNDLAQLQKRWEEAYESMPKLYETPKGLMVNFTLSEDTDTILFKEPWENFELEDDEEAKWRISFFSTTLMRLWVICMHGGRVELKARKAKRIKSNDIPIMLNNEIQGANIIGCPNPPITRRTLF